METELQLLEAIRSGEREALRRLYDRYSGYAMAIGLRYLPEGDEVRDVLQDSFVRILTSAGQFRKNPHLHRPVQLSRRRVAEVVGEQNRQQPLR